MSNPLTKKELEIFGLVKLGLNTSEIASELNISPNTVANHRGNIVKKFGLKGTNSLLKYAVHMGKNDGQAL